MADPDSAREVQGTVAVRGAVNGTDPDAIVAQIESTRENLAQTIDSIAERVNSVAERVNPVESLRRLRERALQQAARPEVRLAAAAVGLAVISVTIIRIWGRRRK
jgi:DNA-binding ferritin-like protein